MERFYLKKIIVLASLVFTMFFAARAFADVIPTLSLSSTGENTVQMSVYGDPNASVILDYETQTGLQGAGVVGYTDSEGYFTTALNPSMYPFTSGTEVLVVVDGQDSQLIAWPYTSQYQNGYGGTLSLSQTNLTLSIGQSSTITAYNQSGSLYVSNNSSSSVANATMYNNNEITITGESYGSTTIEICSTENGCSSVYVTVSYGTNYNNNGYGEISFSQNDVTLSAGQSASVYVYGGSGSNYYVSSGNSGIVETSISGDALNIEGINSGSASLEVCSSSTSECGYVYVTVNGTINQQQEPISFNTNNVQLSVGQSQSVQIDNNSYYYSYYISNNSNPSAVSASISGSIVSVYGSSPGSSNITICQTSYSSCAVLLVNVIGSTTYYPYPYSYPSYNYSNIQYQYSPQYPPQYSYQQQNHRRPWWRFW